MFGGVAAVSIGLIGLCAFSFAQTPVRAPVQASTDRVIVEKGAHRMTLLKDGRVVRTYRVALGRGGLGPKEVAGDNRVPEGIYRIKGRNPNSAYHLSLRIGYPTLSQERAARERGINAGGDIMIHGIRNGLGWIGTQHRRLDWTQGCVAVTNEEIEEIWRIVPDQTVIEIRA
jgi:murein L,D-transpeptidase YafK